MVKASCNVLWEVYIGVLGQGGAPTGPSPLLKINKSPTGFNHKAMVVTVTVILYIRYNAKHLTMLQLSYVACW